MATTYTTHTAVKEFLQLSSAFGSGNPTSTAVEDRINEAEDYVDLQTGHAWRTVTVTNEYHDIDFRNYSCTVGVPIYLKHRSVATLATGSGDKIEVWNGSSWNDWLTDDDRTEGRNNDYWVNYTDGVLYLRNWSSYSIGVRVTYRYGESSVPKDIKTATTLLASIDLIYGDDRSNLLPDGSSQVNYSGKIDRWQTKVDKILRDRAEIRIDNY